MTDQELIAKLDGLYGYFLERSVSAEGAPDWPTGGDFLAEARDRLKHLAWPERGIMDINSDVAD